MKQANYTHITGGNPIHGQALHYKCVFEGGNPVYIGNDNRQVKVNVCLKDGRNFNMDIW